MSALLIILIAIGVVVWAQMGRLCLRMDLAIHDAEERQYDWIMAYAIYDFVFWWIDIPFLYRRYIVLLGRDDPTERWVRAYAGTSRRLKRVQLQREHAQRAQELGMPES